MADDDLDPIPADAVPGPHVSGSSTFPGRTNYSLRGEAWINWQSGTRVSLHYELHVDGSGSTFSGYDKSSWEIWVQGGKVANWGPGKFDFRSGSTRALHYGDVETNVQNNGKIDVDFYANFDILGYTEVHIDVYGTAPTAPKAPRQNQPTNVTTTSMQSTFASQGDGGIAVDQWEQSWATNSAFTQGVKTATSNGTTQLTNLVPGTTYWVRARGHNSIGWGPYSNVVSQATLPAVPPGLSVAASPSGTAATLTFSPPGGVTGVTKYTWERRVTGTTSPVTSGESTVVTATVSGLTPGVSYDWRASAWIGTYQSPWTDSIATPVGTWLALLQPKPNTSPGDYFDGGTTDVADIDYSWTGTANGSTSVATAQGVEGWEATFQNGAAGVLYRVTAGIFSTYAARLQFTADAGSATQRVGQKNAAPYRTEVTPAAIYIGSIHVRPSRSQSLAAEISWITSAGALISRTTGAASVVAGGTWARLVGGAAAPAGAAFAVVRAVDVDGTGWSAWLGGDTMDLDGAMISLNEEFPYFDGNTLYDGTYVYEWDDLPNASVSTRTPVDEVDLAALDFATPPGFGHRALIDPDCAIVPPPPRPPSVPSDCIEDVGVWRRYNSVIPSSLISDWLAIIPTLEITSGSLAARQVRIRYYENPNNLPAEQVPTTSWVAEQIISFMPAQTVLTLDGVTQRAWAEIKGGAPISADHLLYGTNGRPATWPVLSCGIGYLVTVEVPIAEPPGNIEVDAFLTART